MNKITICTVSMNRLFHIRETLPVNISENKRYPAIEFVLLDYNSTDGLEDWVRSNMMDHIESGILKYYKTTEPAYFNISHSKNMASNLSSGDILCMIDADNYAGFNYINWIDSVFTHKGKNSLVIVSEEEAAKYGDLGGKLSFHRDLFARARGFDESLAGYGMDDVDLANRIEKEGGTRVFIENREYLKFIRHTEIDRLKNYYLLNNLENMYIQINDFKAISAVVLYLMKDNTFYEVTYEFNETLRNDRRLSMKGWNVGKDGYKKGKAQRVANGFLLTDEEPALYRKETEQTLVSFAGEKKLVWTRIAEDNPLYLKLVFAYDTSLNFIKYQENDRLCGPVNQNGWGRGTVYLNFDYNNPVYSGSCNDRKVNPSDTYAY